MQLLYNTQKEGGTSIPSRIWGYVSKQKSSFLHCIELALVATLFFGLGMIYALDIAENRASVEVIEPITHETAALAIGAVPQTSREVKTPIKPSQGEYTASKNGTKYYIKGCSNRIKEENKIYFVTKEDAEKAGFSLAKNCSQ